MRVRLLAFLAIAVSSHAFAQDEMKGINMSGMTMPTESGAQDFLMNLASGTSVNPAAWPMPMLSTEAGGWRFDAMAQGFLTDTQQTGPRGSDKLYSTNWFMTSASHKLGRNGAIQIDGMFSLEPATVTDRQYPLLFQTGETALGKAIVDGQHPHNFVMAVGITYAYHVSDKTTFELAFHPVGDPALGPVAYPHRASAMELTQAPISHHLQDSTHISDDVATAGVKYRQFKLEASGFHGAEPDEHRWRVEQGAMDSWSVRLWYQPSENWAVQVSSGHLTHPEALEAGDQQRTTASLAYSKPLPGGSWSSTFIWGRVHYTANHQNANSYLAETVVPLRRLNFVTARFELADKDELFGLAGSASYRIGAYTAGYTRDIPLVAWLETGVGANFTFYTLPGAITPEYGNRPLSGNVYLLVRLRPASQR